MPKWKSVKYGMDGPSSYAHAEKSIRVDREGEIVGLFGHRCIKIYVPGMYNDQAAPYLGGHQNTDVSDALELHFVDIASRVTRSASHADFSLYP